MGVLPKASQTSEDHRDRAYGRLGFETIRFILKGSAIQSLRRRKRFVAINGSEGLERDLKPSTPQKVGLVELAAPQAIY